MIEMFHSNYTMFVSKNKHEDLTETGDSDWKNIKSDKTSTVTSTLQTYRTLFSIPTFLKILNVSEFGENMSKMMHKTFPFDENVQP